MSSRKFPTPISYYLESLGFQGPCAVNSLHWKLLFTHDIITHGFYLNKMYFISAINIILYALCLYGTVDLVWTCIPCHSKDKSA